MGWWRGTAIIETGSRGGVLAVGGGLVVLMFTAGGNLKVRLRNGPVTALALGVLAYAAFTATVMKNRLEATAETGTLAGREQLWPSLVDMALEKPLAGWGPINNQYEVAARTTDMAREHRDAHNLLLELLTALGLAGAAPFLVGLGVALVGAWRGPPRPPPRLALPAVPGFFLPPNHPKLDPPTTHPCVQCPPP